MLAPKNIKIPRLPKSIKISKDHTLDARCFNFDNCLALFGHFSINFPDHLNLLNYNIYNAKTVVFQFPVSRFGIKNHQQIMFLFRAPFLDIIFLDLFCFRKWLFNMRGGKLQDFPPNPECAKPKDRAPQSQSQSSSTVRNLPQASVELLLCVYVTWLKHSLPY